MNVFIVTQWNGMDYEDFDAANVAVFATLDEAVEYCKNTVAYSQYPKNKVIDMMEAYAIQEFRDGKHHHTYSADGKA